MLLLLGEHMLLFAKIFIQQVRACQIYRPRAATPPRPRSLAFARLSTARDW